jgi:hypothetical protein
MDPLDYEGCSTLWFKNWDDAEAFFKSPEYSKLAADCVHFMDTSKGIKVMAGYVKTCLQSCYYVETGANETTKQRRTHLLWQSYP